MSEENIFNCLSKRYPQLMFPIDVSTQNTLEYNNAICKGIFNDLTIDFITSPIDNISVVDTPVGSVEVVFIDNRVDFEHCLQALLYKCEPKAIPKSLGASMITGLVNWEKIHNFLNAYTISGGKNRDIALKLFTSDKKKYTDKIIIISSGFYSAVLPEQVQIETEKWKQLSVIIRKYHEITHYICRELFPDDIDFVRDEIIADAIGIIVAFGNYKRELAEIFLGIENNSYRVGGRLENYVNYNQSIYAVADYSREVVNWIDNNSQLDNKDIFDYLLNIFKKIPKFDVKNQ